MEKLKVCIGGGLGFIGHHLAREMMKHGYWVRCVDIKPYEYGEVDFCDEYLIKDLRDRQNCLDVTKDMFAVVQFASDMGGMGHIQNPKNQYDIYFNNDIINKFMLDASIKNGVKKYLYSSSACIYPNYLQKKTTVKPLKESDAIPCDLWLEAYGWEKLSAEQGCIYARNIYGMDTKIVRFHNIYGEEGTYDGGREKAPAAICRKVIQAIKDNQTEIELWGDGNQVRSFCYIDDCIKAILMVFNSDLNEPVNIGRDDGISINELAKIIIKIGGKKLKINHTTGPLGVRGRNSDNTKFKAKFGWVPEWDMLQGLTKTYKWIYDEISKRT